MGTRAPRLLSLEFRFCQYSGSQLTISIRILSHLSHFRELTHSREISRVRASVETFQSLVTGIKLCDPRTSHVARVIRVRIPRVYLSLVTSLLPFQISYDTRRAVLFFFLCELTNPRVVQNRSCFVSVCRCACTRRKQSYLLRA